MRQIQPGYVINGYTIDRFVATGAISTIYQGRRSSSADRVALKILHPRLTLSQDVIEIFTHEYQIGQMLKHPRIVHVREAGITYGASFPLYYLARDWFVGLTLRELLLNQQPRRLKPERAISFAVQIADVLAFAHAASVTHCDLKPENLFINENDQVYLADFGFAWASQVDKPSLHSAMPPSILFGTLPYMSPEQLQHRAIDGRTDIFALGACLFEVLTGSLPYQGRSPEEQLDLLLSQESPPAVSAISPIHDDRLDRLIQQCLAVRPDERPQSMESISRTLQDIAGSAFGM